MKLNDFPHYARMSFLHLSQVCLIMKRENEDKKRFLEFCDGVWDTVELNGLEKMEKMIQESVMHEIENNFGDKKDTNV